MQDKLKNIYRRISTKACLPFEILLYNIQIAPYLLRVSCEIVVVPAVYGKL